MRHSNSGSVKSIQFSIDKEHYRRIEVEPGVTICHLYPTLSDWVGREIPDSVNPRSHEDDSLKGHVPESIEQTIRDFPEDFYLANRGETVLADSITFDPHKHLVEIVLRDYSGDTACHGVADGGTTDAVIARIQKQVAQSVGVDFLAMTADQIPTFLKNARVHLEVIVGLEDRERIARLVDGRNTSRQVRSWTLADFKGNFDWIKGILESKSSPFRGRIGYEENAAAAVNILEVLSILTLFHPDYDRKGNAPTVAYSSKGRMDKRLSDKATASGYKRLSAVLIDILKLHDHVYATFGEKYTEAFPNGKLGLRGTAENRLFPKVEKRLPLTGTKVLKTVPNGVLYPMLAALRALLIFPSEEGQLASWRINPFSFFDANGAELVQNTISQLEVLQNNPQTMGKTKTVYMALHDRARLLVADATTV